jgi:hypothetical protein
MQWKVAPVEDQVTLRHRFGNLPQAPGNFEGNVFRKASKIG